MVDDTKSLVDINSEELIIDKNTKLTNVQNKEKYNKLILNKKVNPIFLNSFKNIKELELNNGYYNEEKLDKLSFKNNIEKLIIKNIKVLGKKPDNSGYGTIKYSLPTPKLKILELPDIVEDINPNYLNNIDNLETIIFNVSANTKLYLKKNSDYKPLYLPSSLKNIIIKTEFNSYEINFDYIPKYLTEVYYTSYGITIEFSNNYIKTIIQIDNNNVSIKNTLTNISDELITDNCLYIPDYINDINIEEKSALKEIDTININPQKINLSKIEEYRWLTQFLSNIRKIIIRSTDGMKLIPNKEFTVEEYGELQQIYIKDKRLQIVFAKNKFIIDELGNIEKSDVITQQVKEETVKVTENNECNKGARPYFDEKAIIKKYTSKQLEYYSYYKKLLELLYNTNNNDNELTDAMNLIEKRLVKILKIEELEEE